MPIPVTCPGCFSRFTVSDKFAGKEGPCPKCKKKIRIPEKNEEVVIHAPEDDGPKDSKGESLLKPIENSDQPLTKKILYVSISIAVILLATAFGLRLAQTALPGIVMLIGSFLLAVPLSYLGYIFLKDREIGGYFGAELRNRILATAALFAGTWLLYWGLSWYFESRSLSDNTVMQMGIYMVVMLAAGTFISVGAFEFEIWQGILHYLIFFLASIFLCIIMGFGLSEAIPPAQFQTPPAITAPAPTESDPATGS